MDYSGKKIPIVDRKTGEIREAEIFVAVLGASSYTFAEATWTQTLPDWIGSHVRMFRFFHGVPRLVIPDNLKSGVSRASFYDPEINPSYGMMASASAFFRHGRDGRRTNRKWRMECVSPSPAFWGACATRLSSRWLRPMPPLPRRSIASTTTSCAGWASVAGSSSRQSSARLWPVFHWRITSLPNGVWPASRRITTSSSRAFFYSVPHSLIRQQVDLRATARIIEIFHRGKRIAVHQRRYGGPRHGTGPDHMPSSHRRYAEWTPDRFRRWAASVGPETEGLIVAILASRPHPEQGFRTCLDVLRLFRDVTRDRAEAVSARAVKIGGLNCKSIASLIANHKAARHSTEPSAIVDHANLRGPDYFH
ncbi:hypothetical protein [Mesorhizobium sp. WSM1293]|uniref:Mu transposase domain-containing protein n=1 Tax=Mesorhizobium sp. WSM1293 TaxID=1040984 RepID=UPI0004BBEF5A|nr:hypothetical protein [Mesorhizobium sp. WSM1293]